MFVKKFKNEIESIILFTWKLIKYLRTYFKKWVKEYILWIRMQYKNVWIYINLSYVHGSEDSVSLRW